MKMKKFYFLIFVLVFTNNLFARISVKCDVIREKSFAQWTDYYRRDVDFLSGYELGGKYYGNKLYAVIWYSQTQCSIIEMEYNGIINGEIDKNFMYIFLGFDVLNEGKDGVEVNGSNRTKWKIYGKDNYSLFIDPMFDSYPYDEYNKNIRKQIQQGIINYRQRPKEETEYAGHEKGIILLSNDPFYIIKTNSNYIVAQRNTLYYWSGSVQKNDVVMGIFNQIGETKVDNITRNQTGLNVSIKYIGVNYTSCEFWIKENEDTIE